MKDYKQVLRFSSIYVKDSFRTASLYLVWIIIFFIVQFICSGLGAYLHEAGDQMNIFEVYLLFNRRIGPYQVYIIGLLVLILATTFNQSGVTFSLLRINRKKWIASQLLHIFAMVITLNVFFLIACIVTTRGAVTLSGTWSGAALIASQAWIESIGILSMLKMEYTFLRYDPNMLGGIIFLLQTLLGMVMGVILLIFRTRNKLVLGVLVVCLMWFGDWMLTRLSQLWIQYILPFHMACPGNLQVNNAGPSLGYAVVYYVVLLLALIFILFKLSKQIEFIKME